MATANPTSTTAPPLTRIAAEILELVEHTLTAELRNEIAIWRCEDPAAAPVVEALARFVASGGKRLRPLFCIWGHLAGGARDDGVATLAAAIELLHAFALVHDDVMDESEHRRGSLSVHAQFARAYEEAGHAATAARFGESMAILVGDLAHVLAERLLLEQPAAVRREWHAMQVELTRGQTLDVAATMHRRHDAALSRRIAVLKSGRYTVVRPLALGALNAGRADLVAPFTTFGEPVGEAFQLRDDLLGAFGSEAATGKPVGDDLREGKATLLLAYARARASGAGAALLDRVGSPDLDENTISQIQDVLITSGARDEVERTIDMLAERAFGALDQAPIEYEARTALRDLVTRAIWRMS